MNRTAILNLGWNLILLIGCGYGLGVWCSIEFGPHNNVEQYRQMCVSAGRGIALVVVFTLFCMLSEYFFPETK